MSKQHPLLAQIQEAKKNVREMKKSVPYIFPEYHRLLTAQNALAEAEFELDAAKRAWEKMGNA